MSASLSLLIATIVLRAGDAGQVLAGAGDADRDVEVRRDHLAGEADLQRHRHPAQVDDGAAGADGAAQHARQLSQRLEAFGAAEAAAAGDDDLGVLEANALRLHLLAADDWTVAAGRSTASAFTSPARAGVGLQRLLRLRAHGGDGRRRLAGVRGVGVAAVNGARHHQLAAVDLEVDAVHRDGACRHGSRSAAPGRGRPSSGRGGRSTGRPHAAAA